ncbi:MAG: hypothetical protein KDA98_09525 [Acidimicrobiales bacterium]|nr:hypothetical protein [Acidimicrobiales bacterium]
MHELTIDDLDRRRAVVERELAAAAGGASMCAISKVAGSVPAAKHLEGRLGALRDLRRALRKGEPGAEAVARLAARWEAELEAVLARDAGPDWRAYRAGGVDELSELAG